MPTNIAFISPSTNDNSTIADALKDRSGRELVKSQGLTPGVGFWKDGAETAGILTHTEPSALIRRAAELGKMWRQKAVVAFTENKHGNDLAHIIRSPEPNPEKIDKELTKQGIEFKTISKHPYGTVVHVLDSGGQQERDVKKWAAETGAKVRTLRGRVHFVGAEDRDSAQHEFDRVIRGERDRPQQLARRTGFVVGTKQYAPHTGVVLHDIVEDAGVDSGELAHAQARELSRDANMMTKGLGVMAPSERGVPTTSLYNAESLSSRSLHDRAADAHDELANYHENRAKASEFREKHLEAAAAHRDAANMQRTAEQVLQHRANHGMTGFRDGRRATNKALEATTELKKAYPRHDPYRMGAVGNLIDHLARGTPMSAMSMASTHNKVAEVYRYLASKTTGDEKDKLLAASKAHAAAAELHSKREQEFPTKLARKVKRWVQKKIKKLIGEGKTPKQAAGEAYGMVRSGWNKKHPLARTNERAVQVAKARKPMQQFPEVYHIAAAAIDNPHDDTPFKVLADYIDDNVNHPAAQHLAGWIRGEQELDGGSFNSPLDSPITSSWGTGPNNLSVGVNQGEPERSAHLFMMNGPGRWRVQSGTGKYKNITTPQAVHFVHTLGGWAGLADFVASARLAHHSRTGASDFDQSFKGADRPKSVRLARVTPHRQDSHAAAMATSYTHNSDRRRQVVLQILKEAGLQPAAVRNVLAHEEGRGVRSTVLTTITKQLDPEMGRYVASWIGLLSREKAVTVFHPHQSGTDRLHVLDSHLPPEQLGTYMSNAGVPKFYIEDKDQGSRAYVYSPQGQLDLPVQRVVGGTNASHSQFSGSGFRIGSGEGTDADSRASYRNAISGFESKATGGPAASTGPTS